MWLQKKASTLLLTCYYAFGLNLSWPQFSSTRLAEHTYSILKIYTCIVELLQNWTIYEDSASSEAA